MEKVGGCLLAQKGKSGSRLPLKHFHTSVTRIHISNPIYSGTGKIEKENSFVHFFMEYWESILQQGSGEVGRVCLFINLYIKLCMRLPFSRANIVFYEALSKMRWVDSTSGSKYCYDPLSNLQRVALSL